MVALFLLENFHSTTENDKNIWKNLVYSVWRKGIADYVHRNICRYSFSDRCDI